MALADDIITAINSSLTTNLSWLDNAFGKIQKLPRKDSDGVNGHKPEIYSGVKHDYISLLPDEHLGNFSYFEVLSNIEYHNIVKNIKPIFKFKIVFWFDYRSLYPGDHELRTIEEVKAQVLNVLVASPYSKMIEIFDTYENAEDIYSGFRHNEIKSQFLMRPYGGFAIEGELYGAAICAIDLPTPTIPISISGAFPFNHDGNEKIWPYEKWFGSTIYCKTWFWPTGVTGNVTVTGLPVNTSHIFKANLHYNLSMNTNLSGDEFMNNGGTDLEIFQDENMILIYLTVWYVK